MFRFLYPSTREDQRTITLKAELHSIAEDFPQTELDLRAYKDILTDFLLEPILINANKYLKKLILDDCTHLTKDVVHLIAKHCPRIIHLSTRNMLWRAWSTWGYFTDSTFPELQTLDIKGCKNIYMLYVMAPKLKNLVDIAKNFYVITNCISQTYSHQRFTINQHDYHKGDMERLIAWGMIQNLISNNIPKISLNKWDNPIDFINTIAPYIKNNKSLTTLSIQGKSLRLRDIAPLLACLKNNHTLTTLNVSDNKLMTRDFRDYLDNNSKLFRNLLELPLKSLDLSTNYLNSNDIRFISDAVSKNSSLQRFFLSDNDLGGNEGLITLTAALEVNHSLNELKLDGSPKTEYCYYGSTYTNTFDNESLTPFFNMLTKHQSLQSITIAGYFTDQTAIAVNDTLKHNETLTDLHINQHSYECKVISRTANIANIYMTNEGAILIAEGLKENRKLTSFSLNNILFTSEGFKALADALEHNTTITSFEVRRLKKPIHEKCVIKLPGITKSEIDLIKIQEIRIQQYVARNQQQLYDQPCIAHEAFSEEKHDASPSAANILFPNPSTVFPDAPLETTLQLMPIYYGELAKHIHRINKHLGLDEETKKEEFIINRDRRLQQYYDKLCELRFYFNASQSISTMLVAKENDVHDIATMLAAETGKAVLHFIPVVAGLSGIIQAAEAAEHVRHGIQKHHKSINLMLFTRGLGINTENRLIRDFARKLTLKNQKDICNPDAALLANSGGIVGQIIGHGMQKFRECREGHRYTKQEKLALFDLFKILAAIYTETIIPPAKGTEEERFEQLLITMLDYMQQQKTHILAPNQMCAPG